MFAGFVASAFNAFWRLVRELSPPAGAMLNGRAAVVEPNTVPAVPPVAPIRIGVPPVPQVADAPASTRRAPVLYPEPAWSPTYPVPLIVSCSLATVTPPASWRAAPAVTVVPDAAVPVGW